MTEEAPETPAVDVTRLVNEAATKSGLLWVRVPGGQTHPVWHVWHDDGDERGTGPAAYVVSGPGEQHLPWLPEEVELVLRSKDSGGRLLTMPASARELDPGSRGVGGRRRGAPPRAAQRHRRRRAAVARGVHHPRPRPARPPGRVARPLRRRVGHRAGASGTAGDRRLAPLALARSGRSPPQHDPLSVGPHRPAPDSLSVVSTPTRAFVGRLAELDVFDPLGDKVGRVRDVVVTFSASRSRPRAIGLVVEVPGRRRVFVPMTRVTSVEGGQVITTGLVNMRRFEQRPNETLVVAELFERQVQVRVDSGDVVTATVQDVGIEQLGPRGWAVTRAAVRLSASRPGRLGIGRRRGETFVAPIEDVKGLRDAERGTGRGAPPRDLRGPQARRPRRGHPRPLPAAPGRGRRRPRRRAPRRRHRGAARRRPGRDPRRARGRAAPPTSSRRWSPTTPPTSSPSCPTSAARSCSSGCSPTRPPTCAACSPTTRTPPVA